MGEPEREEDGAFQGDKLIPATAANTTCVRNTITKRV